jgi:hypothetical protein
MKVIKRLIALMTCLVSPDLAIMVLVLSITAWRCIYA